MSGEGLEPVKRFVVKGIAGGIGLASESLHARKERKKQEQEAALARSGSHSESSTITSTTPLQEQHPQRYDDSAYNDSKEHLAAHDDEEYWRLDEAQHDLLPPPYVEKDGAAMPDPEENPSLGMSELSIKEVSKADAEKNEKAFIRRHPPPQSNASREKIPLPVILPQRRPKARARGFIRAYAPVLETAGIDQDTWLDFLETFYESSQASPWLNAINLAGIGTLFLPHVASILVGAAITITVQIAMDVQNRQRTNTFLTKANDEFFRPRGLFCLILTYDPTSTSIHSPIDLTSTIHSQINPHGLSHLSHALQNSSGTTHGELEFPEAAPLVFPELDKLAAQSGLEAEQKMGRLKKAGAFVDEYYDKRARARYAYKHPDSALVQGPHDTFHSRYADPNNPASSGSFVSLVTGGKINPPPMSRGIAGRNRGMGLGGLDLGGGFGGWGASRREIVEERLFGRGYGGNTYAADNYRGSYPIDRFSPSPMSNRTNDTLTGCFAGHGLGQAGTIGFGGPMPIIKKVFKKDVLYLMVVNMPTDEELAAAMAELDKMRNSPQQS